MMPPIQQFAALADETRCRVLDLLHARPRPVHELAAEFAISRPAISRHLRVLREAGLVREEKRGRENVYAMDPARLDPAGEWLARFAPLPVTEPVELEPAELAPNLPAAPSLAAERKQARARPKAAHAAMPDLFGFVG